MTTHPMPPALRRFAEFLAANPSPAEVVEGRTIRPVVTP